MEFSSSFSLTDKGLQRSNNEDTFLDCPEQGLWVVADGMGGHEGGEIASDIVRRTLYQQVEQHSSLPLAIEKAHIAVLNHSNNFPKQSGMGSTIVALKNDGLDYQIAWVGDSRAYLWTPTRSGGELHQLTNDHSYVQGLVDLGTLAPEDARHHPDKNIITQCLGAIGIQQLHIETVNGVWQPGQRILLCSDGLTNEVSDDEIARVMCHANNSAVAAITLLEAALAHGGNDNITVQVIESPCSTSALPPKPKASTTNPDVQRYQLYHRLLISLLVCVLLVLIWFLAGGYK